MYELTYQKEVLFIPIFSMRSYVTGIYKLENDGNMARIMSKLIELNYKHATVFIPKLHTDITQFENKLKEYKKNVTFVESNGYQENAAATRSEYEEFMNEIFTKDKKYDIIISEPNILTYKLVEMQKEKQFELIYWCVASITTEGMPWFVSDFSAIDTVIAQKVITACATISQVKALKGKSYVEEFYLPGFFDLNIIFFPFRLTDRNYKAIEFKKRIEEMYGNKNLKDFIVLYTDMNDSGIFEDKKPFKKIPSDKELYLAILKSKPIIPYFENEEMLLHISYVEFKYYGCNIVTDFDELERMLTK